MAEKNAPGEIMSPKWVIILGCVLLLGYALITAFVVYEKSHRDSVEKTVELPLPR